MAKKNTASDEKTLDDFLGGKSELTVSLFHHFIEEYQKIGKVTVRQRP